MKKNDKLLFEGAGWDKAEHNGVGNCRVRTRIKNLDGDLIYFECTSLKKHQDFIGYVSHCFNNKDEKSNYTRELKHIERLTFKYTGEGLLNFVNKHLNCDFKSVEVNNIDLRVHNTKLALCSCYKGVGI